jgi:uncharacterized protein (TIGR03083 family)
MLDLDAYVGSLRASAASLADVVAGADVATPVPSCSEWTLADLVRHLGTHHRWVRANLDRAPDDGMAPFDEIEEPPPVDLVADWIREGAEALAQRLVELGSNAPCWTWTDDQVSGFWARRTSHETEIHGWDGTNAVGAPLAIDPTLASDGIDEWLTLAASMSRVVGGDGKTMHVHCIDAAGEWLVRLAADGVVLTREHAAGDVTVRGPADELFLLLTRRLSVSSAPGVVLIGDESVFSTWYDHAQF